MESVAAMAFALVQGLERRDGPESVGGAVTNLPRSERPGADRGVSPVSYTHLNRLIAAKSSYRRGGLAPRCRLVTSWGWRRSHLFNCSALLLTVFVSINISISIFVHCLPVFRRKDGIFARFYIIVRVLFAILPTVFRLSLIHI